MLESDSSDDTIPIVIRVVVSLIVGKYTARKTV